MFAKLLKAVGFYFYALALAYKKRSSNLTVRNAPDTAQAALLRDIVQYCCLAVPLELNSVNSSLLLQKSKQLKPRHLHEGATALLCWQCLPFHRCVGLSNNFQYNEYLHICHGRTVATLAPFLPWTHCSNSQSLCSATSLAQRAQSMVIVESL